MKKSSSELSLKWETHIREAESGDFTIKEYCQKNGLMEGQYYYWQHKLRNNSQVPPSLPVRFSELSFLPEENGTSGLSIYFGDRIKVVPETGFNETEFVRIARLLKGVCKC